jgi:transcriptional regulator with PAS, ATPase and Fis domain
MVSVLVTGETGAGKEWVASEIHRASPRGAGPYVRVNCAALPETLVEAELFGHEKGAFTGADRRRIGRLESAHGGTVFLDEIGELPLPMQAKLLHVLEDRAIVRVGANQPQPIDVRFVAATNRDLEGEIRAGRFREDLYFRLSAITIHMPPLRERPADLAALAEHFLVESARAAGRRPPRMSPGFRAALESYPWPGNVRELKNAIERAVVLGDGDELGARALPDRLRVTDAPPATAGPLRQRLDDVERTNLETALAETGGNRTHAARRLGISRRALIYKLQKTGLGAKA